MLDTMTDTAPDLATAADDKPYHVRTQISAHAGRILAAEQVRRGPQRKSGRLVPLPLITAELLEAALLALAAQHGIDVA